MRLLFFWKKIFFSGQICDQSPAEVDEFSSKFFEYHGFLQCIGAIDGTPTEIKESKEHCTDFGLTHPNSLLEDLFNFTFFFGGIFF